MQTASYNRFSRWLHWLIAGLIIFMIFLGWRLGDHDSERLSRINVHKSVGILILILSLARIGARLAYKAPADPPMPKWQALAAKTLHLGFYVVMIGMPLTGWAMVSTSIRPIPFFGLLDFPHLPVPQTKQVHEIFENLHGILAKLIIYAMIPLHVAAALKHHFVDKDEVFEHMVPGLKPEPIANWRWIIPIGVVAVASVFGFGLYRGAPDKVTALPSLSAESGSPDALTPANAASSDAAVSLASGSEAGAKAPQTVTTWTVEKAATRIGFTTAFQGEAINGKFGSYTADITFDPERLEASHVRVSIDLASVGSGDGDRDETLKGASFFNVQTTPRAVFEAKSFTKKDDRHFVAHGRLSLHGVTKPLDLPFTLSIKNKIATMSGTVPVDRTVFGVGSGDYASPDTIPPKVQVDIELKARASN